VAGVEEGLDLAVEDAGVGRVMHDRADDDAHLDASLLVNSLILSRERSHDPAGHIRMKEFIYSG
jgi:hypothetical protein